jgi:hypothetical protein
MNFLKKLFGSQPTTTASHKRPRIENYNEFWNWFSENATRFHKVVKEGKAIEKKFFDVLEPKLNSFSKNIFFLCGMLDDHTAELILTPEGNLKYVAVIEDLIKSAPDIKNWTFTALKPKMAAENCNIEMNGYLFNPEAITFCPKIDPRYPDEITIHFFHKQLTEDNKDILANGIYIFLEHIIGEHNFITTIDYSDVKLLSQATEKPQPIEKLESYLKWRTKEFIDKYDSTEYNSEEDSFTMLEASDNGLKIIAVVNTSLMAWENKSSHPWFVIIDFKFSGSNDTGMPTDSQMKNLEDLEEEITTALPKRSFLNIARQTGNFHRKVYLAFKDFRQATRTLNLYDEHSKHNIELSYDIYKDKYWMTLNRFKKSVL